MKVRFPVALPVAVFLLVVFSCATGWTESAGDMEISGHLKSLNTRLEPSSYLDAGIYSSSQLRVDVQGEISSAFSFEVAATNDLVFAEQDLDEIRPYLHKSVNRRFHLNAVQSEERHADALFDIDRLLARGRFGAVDWIVGRQALGLGRMTLLSPLDVIEPFSAVAVDTEVRPGVDALRLTRYFGLGGQVGGIVVAGDVAANNSYLATFSDNLDGVDVFLMGGSLRERPMMGAGVAADVGGLGLKVEAAAYKGRDSKEHGTDLYSEFVIAGAEVWHRFENGLSVRAEYLYNGAGTDCSGQYLEAAGAASAKEGLNSFLGQHYLLFEPSFELHPLVTLEGLAIWNMGDDSLFVRPMLDISVTDNVAMQVFWAVTLGEEPYPETVLGMPSSPGSEFGTVNDYGGFNVTYYF